MENETDDYEFEPNIPEDIYLKTLIPEKFKDDVEQLVSLTGKSIKEFPIWAICSSHLVLL